MIKSVKGEKISTGKIINYEIFDYLSEIVKTNRERKHRHNEDTVSGEREMEKGWDGANSYEEAEDMAIHGWKDLDENEMLEGIFNYKNNRDEEKLVTFKNDVVGFAPIIPLVLQGIPNSMQDVAKKRVKSKIIHIVYNISTCCGTSPTSLLETGINLFKVIVKLERQGYRVRLTAIQDFTGRADENVVSTDILVLNLKSEYKPLDISSIMFPLLHPAMFRGLGFAWFERSPVTIKRSGYGTSLERIFGNKETEEVIKKIIGDNQEYKYIWFDKIEGNSPSEIMEKYFKKI